MGVHHAELRLRSASEMRLPAGEAGYLDSVSQSVEPKADLGRRPNGVSDETVEAVGSVSEALEFVERARGRLYRFTS
jgi:hypothetical protein